MLLSMYASYHWARKEDYALVVVFVLLSSFCSTFFKITPFLLFYFPVALLSFPFYAYRDEIFVGNILEGNWVSFQGIRFLTIDVHNTQVSYELRIIHFIITFSFFLLVNFVGAILGYEMSKIRRIREWGTSGEWSVLGVILWGAFSEIGLWLGTIGTQIDKYGHLLLGPYWVDAVAFFSFGILVLAIVIGRILWPKIWRTH